MMNIFFPDEQVTKDDLFFVCYMIERVARKIHQHNQYVVNAIGEEELVRLLCLANVLHSDNPVKIEDEWIEVYHLEKGAFDIMAVDEELVEHIPTPTQMGRVYKRLIADTLLPNENYAQGILRVYNDSICETIDNYNCSAYYEPSYVIARAYNYGGF